MARMETIWYMFSTLVTLIKTFRITDLIDILLVAFIIYKLIKLLRETRAGQLIKGLMALAAVYSLSWIFNFKMLHILLDNIFQFTVLVVLIMFQPEFRRALEQLGHGSSGGLEHVRGKIDDVNRECIRIISTCAAAFQMSKTGALIVFERTTKLGDIIETGTVIDAVASVSLVGNIFFNKAPLHDGALIIRDGRIYAAGCILPLTTNENLNIDLGTRHRAALGMSENSDAILLVVSEETGNISIAINGILKRNYTKDSLRRDLEKNILPSEDTDDIKNIFKLNFWKKFRSK
jgi:diadenylate cyclase